MNKREKIMAAGVLVALAAGLGFRYLAQNNALDYFARLDRQIADKRAELKKVSAELEKIDQRSSTWRDIGSETLSVDPMRSRTLLINELDALMVKHGLTQRKVRPAQGRTDRTGLSSVRFTLEGESSLSNLVSFLYDLYNRPFAVRVLSVKLAPTGGRNATGLKLNLSGETIVLPPMKSAPPVTTAQLGDGKGKPVIRTAMAELGPYLVLDSKKIFERFVPRAPTPGPVTDHRPTPGPTQPVDNRPKRDFDPARTSTTVTAVMASPDTQCVVLTGADKRRRIVRTGEAMDGGTLIYVHPDGAVVVYKEKDDDKAKDDKKDDGKLEKDFYPLGKKLSDMSVLTEDLHPEVYFVVSQMERQRAAELQDGSGRGT